MAGFLRVRALLTRISSLQSPNGISIIGAGGDTMLLTKEEVAALARVKVRTVTSWVQGGSLRAVKAGPRLNRFLLRDVERFLGVPPGSLRLPEPGAAVREVTGR
jgi:excisionase family DNA binding protein